MKHYKLIRSIVNTTLLFSVVFAATAMATSKTKKIKDGWSEAYGGSAEIAEFIYMATNILFFSVGTKALANVDKNKIIDVIKNSKVICSKNLTLNGEDKDGVNYPKNEPQMIYLDCEKWSDKMSLQQKQLLSVHEYLPLLGKIDEHYILSSELVRHYKAN